MPNPSAREAMHVELRRQGLPRADIARLLEEWDDHLQDLITEQGGTLHMETQEHAQVRLGHPDLLVAAAVANHRQSSFFGRHPVWTFVLAPIPLLFLSWVTFALLLLGVGTLVDWAFDFSSQMNGKPMQDWPPGTIWLIEGTHHGFRFVPPAFAALVLGWLGRRCGLRLRWTILAIVLVTLVAACFRSQLVYSDEPGKNSLTFGFGFPLNLASLPQALVPLAVGALFIYSMLRRRKLATAAS